MIATLLLIAATVAHVPTVELRLRWDPRDTTRAGLGMTTRAPDSVAAATLPPDSAAAAARSVLTLPEVRVERDRPVFDARHRQPTGFVSDVRAGDTGHALETLCELLSRTAAVRIQQYGGLGSFATVSLRGAPPSQLSVYLDGVPLTSAAGTIVNFSDLPVTAVDRLEVYRGPSPLELGPVTPGGAINVVTLSPSALRRLSLKLGSFGTWEGVATAGARHGAWSALIHAGMQGSRGDFGYWDDNGTPLNPNDDATSVRQNNRFESRTLLATAKGALPLGVALTLRQNLFWKSQGVPGLGSIPAQSTHLALDRSLGLIELARPGSRVQPGVKVQLSIDRSRSRFTDRLGELGSGLSDTDDRFHGGQLRLIAESPRIRGGLTIESSALLRDERANLHDGASGRADPPPSRRVTQGASLGLRLEQWAGRVLVRAGRRWDRQCDALRWTTSLGVATATDLERQLNSPQLGARVRVMGPLDIKANWTLAHRAPDFLELFGNEGSIRGNPALQPERSENWDAGGVWTLPASRAMRGSIEWAHYEQRARDLIAYMSNSASSVKAMNIARARIRGEELIGRLELPRGVSFSGWWTWQSTLNQGKVVAERGRRLPLRPERHAFGQLGWRHRLFELSADLEYLSEDFLDGANRKRVESRTFAGVTAGIRALPGVRVQLEAKNLGDVRAADVAGFPLPGRSLFLSCEWDAAPHAHP